jgi:hypothetical protein
MCDLSDADVGVGQHRLGSLDVVVGEFWRTATVWLARRAAARPAWVRIAEPVPSRTKYGTVYEPFLSQRLEIAEQGWQ